MAFRTRRGRIGLALGLGLLAGPAFAGPFDEPGVLPEEAVGWADRVIALERGPVDSADPASPPASFGTAEAALGPASSDGADVVSLGEGGSIVLGFDLAIADAPGADLAVFENGFFTLGGLFAELAFVEVSSDGEHFVRFPARSLTPLPLDSFDPLDPSDVHGLAGRHPAGEGTGFDLAELADDPWVREGRLDLGAVGFVRVVDVVGDGADLDAAGEPIFDPTPTPFASSGFDLDAVAVLHAAPEPALAGLTCLLGLLLVHAGRARRLRAAAAGLLMLPAGSATALTVDLEDLGLPPESFYDGSDGAGGFTSRGAFFNNEFTDFGGGFTAWRGFGYSNVTDNTTFGFGNQFSAFPGGGAAGTATYAVSFALDPNFARITLPTPSIVSRASFANTTLTAGTLRNGDAFSKKFGGPDGRDPDFYSVIVTGLDASGAATGSIEVFLADFRFPDDRLDFILDDWLEVDLRALGVVSQLAFSVASSDVGEFGINTPAYFALDELVLVPEPSTGMLGLLGLVGVRAWRRLARRG